MVRSCKSEAMSFVPSSPFCLVFNVREESFERKIGTKQTFSNAQLGQTKQLRVCGYAARCSEGRQNACRNTDERLQVLRSSLSSTKWTHLPAKIGLGTGNRPPAFPSGGTEPAPAVQEECKRRWRERRCSALMRRRNRTWRLHTQN